MLRPTLKLTSVFLIVVIFMTATLPAQTLSNSPQKEELQKQENQTKETPRDLKQVISKETARLKNETASVDAKSMDKERRRQTSRSNWTTRDTILVVGIAIAIVGIVLTAIYSKKCKRYEPRGCSLSDNSSNCRCAEYEEDE